VRIEELKDPRDREYCIRAQKGYRGAAGRGPYNPDPFSTLEIFLLMMNGIDVENDYNLDILADYVMTKEFASVPN